MSTVFANLVVHRLGLHFSSSTSRSAYFLRLQIPSEMHVAAACAQHTPRPENHHWTSDLILRLQIASQLFGNKQVLERGPPEAKELLQLSLYGAALVASLTGDRSFLQGVQALYPAEVIGRSELGLLATALRCGNVKVIDGLLAARYRPGERDIRLVVLSKSHSEKFLNYLAKYLGVSDAEGKRLMTDVFSQFDVDPLLLLLVNAGREEEQRVYIRKSLQKIPDPPDPLDIAQLYIDAGLDLRNLISKLDRYVPKTEKVITFLKKNGLSESDWGKSWTNGRKRRY